MKRILILAALMGLRELLIRVSFDGIASSEVRIALNFGFLLLCAYLVGEIFAQWRLPKITGYIAAGLCFGPYATGYLGFEGVRELKFIDDVALTLIALAAGGELRIATLRYRLTAILNLVMWITLIVFAGVGGCFILASGAIPFMQGLEQNKIIMIAAAFGILCVARSPSSTIAVISECKARGTYSETVLGVTVIMDVVVIVLFSIILSIYGRFDIAAGADAGSVISAGLLGEILVSFGAGGLLGWLVVLYIRRVKVDLVIFLVGLAFLVTKFSHGLASFLELHYGTIFHIEPMLICMAAGFVIQNLSEEGGRFLEALDRSSLPVYVTFFAITGASLDLDALWASWHIALGLVIVRITLIAGGTRISSFITKEEKRLRNLYGLGFITQAGVSLGLVQVVAARYPEWGVPFATIAVAAITINQIIGPIAFKTALIKSGETALKRRKE